MSKLNIPILTRVEGEGGLELAIEDGQITKLNLQIFEPPRLFEKFLEGREPNEVIDAVARICGICPVAYQMSAVQALEQIFNVEPSDWVKALRRLFYCGEWIESHAVHIHMLAGPDFLNYRSSMEMAKDHPELVKRGMKLHALGNELMTLIGKRAVHPVGACVGGFYAAPKQEAVDALLQKFEQSFSLAQDLVTWTASLDLPDYGQTFPVVALRNGNRYPMNEGKIVSSSGLSIDKAEYAKHFKETHAPYSTALHSTLNDAPYLVGPLARLNLNHDLMDSTLLQLASPITFPSFNMFHSIVARAIELCWAMQEAIILMKSYQESSQPYQTFKPRKGEGFGATEAPRGLLWHRYTTDEQGLISHARIVPPTSQNQCRIEQDLQQSLENFGLDSSDDDIRQLSEMVIRNYDPCISCSTHFLKLKVARQ